MATSNFARPQNASKYFVVLTNETAPNEWDCEDFIENITTEIEGHKNGQEDNTEFRDRNYQRTCLGALNISKWYGDVEVSITIRAILQSAYYDGATLDYQILVFNGYEDLEIEETSHWKCTIEDVLKDLFNEDYSEMNAGLRAIQKNYAEQWVKTTITNLSKELETIYETFSSHKLQCDGVFSSGEAVYSEIKD